MEKYCRLLKQRTRKSAYREFVNMNKAKSQLIKKRGIKMYVPCCVKPKMMVVHWERICLPIQETQVWSLDQEDPLEEEIATHFSILAWKIPWTEEPGGLQPMRLQSQTRLGDWARLHTHSHTHTHTHTHTHKRGEWQQKAHSIIPVRGNRGKFFFRFSWLPSVFKSWYTSFYHD